MVARLLAKEKVAGSNPVSRSRDFAAVIAGQRRSNTLTVDGKRTEGRSPQSAGIPASTLRLRVYRGRPTIDTVGVAKHLVDLHEEMLDSARAELGTTTIKDTVNEAVCRATSRREHSVAVALDVLARAHLDDRADAWR